jgi:hypothetical protein
VAVLEAAYDDAAGVTAAFNLNALAHINRLIGSDFDLTEWKHVAFFNREASRIEMHLEAVADVQLHWPGGGRSFARGERIHTENSYKYDIEGFAGLLDEAGFHRTVAWTDPQRWFAVVLACRESTMLNRDELAATTAKCARRHSRWPRRCRLKTQPRNPCPTRARPSGTSRTAPGSSRPSCWSAGKPASSPSTLPFRVLFNSYYNAVGDKHPRAQRGC